MTCSPVLPFHSESFSNEYQCHKANRFGSVLFLVMAEDKVLQSKEELGLKSESSSGERKHISTNCSMHLGERRTNIFNFKRG